MTTLRDAAEALTNGAELLGRGFLDGSAFDRGPDGRVQVRRGDLEALRAALAAEAAWRARAEAAIAWAEESRKLQAMWNDARNGASIGGDYLRQVDAAKDARRRYEETCRAPL